MNRHVSTRYNLGGGGGAGGGGGGAVSTRYRVCNTAAQVVPVQTSSND